MDEPVRRPLRVGRPDDEGRRWSWRRRAPLVGAGLVLLVMGAAIGRITAPDGETVAVISPDAGAFFEFPKGDANRERYWGLVGLKRLVADTFDRREAGGGLGTTGTGNPWTAVGGEWGITGGRALLEQPAPTGPNLVVVPEGTGDGLMEVTMTAVENGAGLVFRYANPDNYWTVTANRSTGSWSVSRVIDGSPPELVAEVPGPTEDGVTVTLTQAGPTLRLLIDSVAYFSADDRALSRQLQAGLYAPEGSVGEARWDRFLTMADTGSGPSG